MKGDFSRTTFDRTRHYSGVRMQQGRVQLDADWNEESAITAYRAETGARDLIGGCGGPAGHAGFRLVTAVADLPPDEREYPENRGAPVTAAKPGDLLISGGRYYVGGKLAENEKIVLMSKQPDLPLFPKAKLFDKEGVYLIYLDVWERHITALDDPAIHEVALGEPDTGTRVKTVWQVKPFYLGADEEGGCSGVFPRFNAAIAPATGTMSARTSPSGPDTPPCSVAPGAGFRGLENQLYRVEVRTAGAAIDAGVEATIVVDRVGLSDTGCTRLELGAKGPWKVGDAVEIVPAAPVGDSLEGIIAFVGALDGKNVTLTTAIAGLAPEQNLRVRPVGAAFVWSRDNGSVVTSIEKIKGDELTVHDLGRDSVLGFKAGDWVEISDDLLELNGLPGQLAQIRDIDTGKRIITLMNEPAKLASTPEGVDPARHPRLRRWDGAGAIKFAKTGDGYIPLEDGIQVRFTAGSYRTGDYWMIPARTATSEEQSGNIEWPVDPATTLPLSRPPAGIVHHYCRIAMVSVGADRKVTVTDDCRCLFSPLTRLSGFFYVGGDGQEARPTFPMPQLLQVGVFNVGVANNCVPVAGAKVRFSTQAGGLLAASHAGLGGATSSITVETDSRGIASVAWRPDPTLDPVLMKMKWSQQVEARLLNAQGRE